MKKKIVVFHRAIAPYRIDFFNALNDNYDCSFYFEFRNPIEQTFDNDIQSSRIKFKANYLKKGALGIKNLRLSIWSILNREKPDIVFCSEYNLITAILLIYKSIKRPSLRIISICDDNIETADRSDNEGFIKSRFRRWITKRLSAIILCNKKVVKWYKKKALTDAQIWYLPIVQDEKYIRTQLKEAFPIAKQIYKDLNLKDKQILLFVGRLADEKNIPLLINTFREITDKYKKAVLFIVGDGELNENLRNFTERIGLQDKIIFTGKKEGKELYAYYYLGDVLILPSKKEKFGAVVNEALVSGCRVICSSVAGAATLIKKENGRIFTSNSEIDLKEKIEYELDRLKDGKRFKSSLKRKLMPSSFAEYMTEIEIKITEISDRDI